MIFGKLLAQVGRTYIVDATEEEESQMSSAMSIAVNSQGHICGITKRGGAGLDPSVLLDMISVAREVSKSLISTVDAEIFAAETRVSEYM
jgi:exosome complex component RRP42